MRSAPTRRTRRSRAPTPRSRRSSTRPAGRDEFLERYAVVLCSDHGQSLVEQAARLDVEGALVDRLEPRGDALRRRPARARRGARRRAVGRRRALPRGRRGGRAARRATRTSRCSTSTPTAARAPRPRSRNPNAGEVLVSAAPGWEFADLAGRHHVGGGSHGSLARERLRGADADGRARRAAGLDHGDQGARCSSTSGSASPGPRERPGWIDGSSPPRDSRRARARGDGARAARALRPRGAARARLRRRGRCRSRSARRSRSRTWSRSSARRSRSTATSACSTSAPARATRRRCSPSSPREVHSIERIPELAERARGALAAAGYERVHVHVGDGALGLPEHAPFDGDRGRGRRGRVPPAALGAARRRAAGSCSRSAGRASSGSACSSERPTARAARVGAGRFVAARGPSAGRPYRRGAPGTSRTTAVPRIAAASLGRVVDTSGRAREPRRAGAAAAANWIQLAKFGVVGAQRLRRQPRRLRAPARGRRPLRPPAVSFVVSRRATTGGTATGRSRTRRATSATRGCASSSSRSLAFAANQLWLFVFLDWLGWGKIVAQAIAIVLVTPLNFLGNKLWSFRAEELSLRRAARGVLALVAGAAAAPPRPLAGVTPPAPRRSRARLTHQVRRRQIFLADPKVAGWLERYPPNPTTDATFTDGRLDGERLLRQRPGEIATGTVDDVTGHRDSRRGPGRRSRGGWRAAARARSAARRSTATRSGSASAPLFLLGLVDWRRPLSLRNLDLLCCSRSRSRSGSSTTATSSRRCRSSTRRSSGCSRAASGSAGATARRAARPSGRSGCSLGATVFLAGFRIGLNVRDSNVIDVGSSGVIGAERIAHGQSPYGNFPIEDDRPACGPADANGEIRDRIQTNGRCEAADAQGDTYGPVAYEAYLPGYWLFGWSGKWDTLPPSHATSILWDLLCAARARARRLALRRAAARGDARVRLGGLAVLAVRVELEHERRDPAGAAHLGLLLRDLAALRAARSRRSRRGRSSRRSLVLPLWSGYPDARRLRPRLPLRGRLRRSRRWPRSSSLLLEPSPLHAARVFFDRTFGYQIGRDSPFSLWDWRQYHAKGLPDLHLVQHVLAGCCSSSARSRSAAGRAAARRSSSPRSPARC